MTDLHVTRQHGRRWRRRRLTAELCRESPDLLLLTGDYMSYPGDEAQALQALEELTASVHPRLGIYGVFGNHDLPEFRAAAKKLPIRWLLNQCERFPDLGLEILGLDVEPDYDHDSVALLAASHAVAAALAIENPPPQARHLRLLMAHLPTFLSAAGDLGVDVMFSGHTHGGQCRLPTGRAFLNSCDLPLRLTSGILRHQHTLAVVSRGLGEVRLPLRVFCPPQLPLCTFRRGPLLGRHVHHFENLRPW